MKGLLSLFMLLSAVLAVSYANLLPLPRPRLGQPRVPTFPGGTPPFNPYPGTSTVLTQPLLRVRRSPDGDDDDKNSITIKADEQGGRPSYSVDYQRQIYENKYGSIGANVGVSKNRGQKPDAQVGISGSFHW